jgi:hypothetical protein
MEQVVGAPKIAGGATTAAAVDRRRLAALLPVLAPAAVVAALFALAAPALVVADTWLALVAGREIWKHGLPHFNALTVIHHGQPWVDQQWLGHLTLYGADRVGGLGFVVAVTTAAVLCGFCLAALAALERGAPPIVLLIFFAVAFLAGVWIAVARTQALAVPLYGLVLWLVCRDPGCGRRLTLLTVPALCLWANIHGSVLLGAAVLAGYGLLAAARSRSRQGALLFVAAPLCVLASPYATALPGYYRLMLDNPPFKRWINEWQPTVPAKDTAVFFCLAAVVAVILVIRRRGGLDALILVVSFAAALSAVRMLPWFGIASLAVVPPLFWHNKPAVVRGRGAEGFSIVMIGVIAICLIVGGARGRTASARVSDLARAPIGAHDLVYSDLDLADRLLWARPELRGRVAYDARVELLSAQGIHQMLTFNARAPGWRSVAAGYTVLAFDPRSPAPIPDLSGWRVVYRSSNAVLARRPPATP